MNIGFYFLHLAVALIGISAFLHISKCDGEHVTRAEFDKRLAEIRLNLERLGASGRDDSVANETEYTKWTSETIAPSATRTEAFVSFHGKYSTKSTAERNDK